jgi:hypothetical protein
VRVGGVLTEVVVPSVPFDADTPYLLILSTVPRSSAYILRGTAIRHVPSWSADLRPYWPLLPIELERNEVTFAGFIEALKQASAACEGA